MIRKDNCPVCGAKLDQPLKDEVLQLFALWKKQRNEYLVVSMGERTITKELIKKYGFEMVKDAFVECCTQPQRMTLSYARSVLRGMKDRMDVKKQVTQSQQSSAGSQQILNDKDVKESVSDVVKKFRVEKFGTDKNKYLENDKDAE